MSLCHSLSQAALTAQYNQMLLMACLVLVMFIVGILTNMFTDNSYKMPSYVEINDGYETEKNSGDDDEDLVPKGR